MTEKILNVAVLGVTGRMGHALISAISESEGVQLTGASASPNSRWVGHDVGAAIGRHPCEVQIASDPRSAVAQAKVAIDFTLPEVTSANVQACLDARCALVLGTTGHDAQTREFIAQAARSIPIVHAPNMSLGVNLLLKLVETAARTLDTNYDIEVFEAHHRHKKDAPSGTALALGRVAAKGRGAALDDLADYARQGATGERRRGAIGFSVFRGGDVVGDHTVTFAGIGERIELTHRASDRLAFARGAVTAAKWVAGREAGLYSMQDVLGLA